MPGLVQGVGAGAKGRVVVGRSGCAEHVEARRAECACVIGRFGYSPVRHSASGIVSGQGQTDHMTASRNVSRHTHADLTWVQSMGGPQNVFLRWLAADSDGELLEAAQAVLDDPATDWEDCVVWETDGAAVLLDSAVAGSDLAVEHPDQGGLPEQALISVPAGCGSVRAFHKTGDFPWVGLVQLLPASSLSAV